VSSPPPGPNYSWQPENRDYKSAPTYGQPPKKSRAGLIIALIVILILIALGAIGVLVQRLVSSHHDSTANPGPGTSIAPPPAIKTARPTAPKTTTGG
jgi:flagellar basal body-associated protein FliL